MRILIGTHEIGRQVYDLADGLRRLGHEVDSVVAFRNPWVPELEYTYVYDQAELAEFVQAVQKKPILQHTEPMKVLNSLLSDYDLYIFNFANSLLPWNGDLAHLKQNGKKIVMLFQGSDVRHWSAAEPVAASYGYRIPSMYRTSPYNHLGARLHNMRMAELYADAVFSLPFQSELAIRPYHHIVLPIDLSLYEENIPARDVPVLVHAPSRRNFKGTETFLKVLDRLKAEGVAFELKLLENVPNQEVLRSLVDADVVLDELNSPHYAILALEGMASGCAVVAGCDRGYVPLQGESPVYAVRSENLYDRLKLLLTDKALRLDCARRGREFVKTHHDHVQVAAHILSKLDPAESVPDYYPTFFAESYTLSPKEAIPDSVPVMTAEIIQRWGLPEGVRSEDLVERGVASPVAPGRPVLNWKPVHTNVKKEAWGWSPGHRDPALPETEVAAGIIIRLAQQASQAVLGGDHDTAGVLLQECVACVERFPDALEDTDATVAVGRLAQELGELELAAGLFAQAFNQAPDREDLREAAERLQESSRAAA